MKEALFEVQVVEIPANLPKAERRIGRRGLISAAAAAACAVRTLVLGRPRETLVRRIADDFAAGRVGLVDGWVLAETEIRLLAAPSSSRSRSERA